MLSSWTSQSTMLTSTFSASSGNNQSDSLFQNHKPMEFNVTIACVCKEEHQKKIFFNFYLT